MNRHSSWLLVPALAGAVGAAWMSAEGISAATPELDGPVRGAPTANAGSFALMNANGRADRGLGSGPADPFYPTPVRKARVAAPAPAIAPVAPVVAPPPVAPPFPYRFVGRVTGSGGAPVVYLALDERLLTVRAKGDIGDGYEVEELTNRHLVIMHRASQQRTSIDFGADSHGSGAR